jgi:hypothetical protein
LRSKKFKIQLTKMMKKLNLLFLMMLTMFALSSCGDDDDATTSLPPTITAPSAVTNVQVGNPVDLTFTVNTPGGFSSAQVSAQGGTATVASAPAAGATSGSVVVNYIAGATAGAGSVTLTVDDNANLSDSESATINITAEPQPTIVDVFASEDGLGTVTWSSNNIYVLRGFVYVNSGQTLTIEPGTVIKGQPGQGAGASALIVARGGTIIANGSATDPIIFTALADDINDPEDLPLTERGRWGGVILLGGAPINHANGETIIEGLPETDDRSLYGNGTPNDFTTGVSESSGELSYISIRHGGSTIGANNEINGLTMGGVGNGTSIHHIEIWGNDDDGFEWFGGRVNTSYLASLYNQDDSFDADFGWIGQNQFWVAFQEPGFTASDRGMEFDGAHSGNLGATQFTNPTVYNMTLVGALNTGAGANAMFFTEGCAGSYYNSIITNFRAGINLTDVGAAGNNSRNRLADGDLVFGNNIFWQIGAKTTLAEVAEGLAALETHLADNDNSYVDPQLGGLAIGSVDLTPAAAGPAFSDLAAVPADVDGFTYEDVDYKGAFGADNWLAGWTAAATYGIF